MGTIRIVRATKAAVYEAVQIIKEGGLVVYPTDTVYGLGCDPFNISAVKRVMKTKGRWRKPLPVLGASLKNVEQIVWMTKDAYKLAKKFWPGALTLVLKKKPILPEAVTCGSNTVGVRIPNNAVALQLIQLSGGLLIGTSANITGKPSPRTAEEVSEQIGENVDLILDTGASQLGKDSTVLNLSSNKPRILRLGPIGVSDLVEALEVRARTLYRAEGKNIC